MARHEMIRTHATRWDLLALLGGALLALLAAMTLALPLDAATRSAVWIWLGLSLALFLAGAGLAWRRQAQRTASLAEASEQRWQRRAPWGAALLVLSGVLLWWTPPAPWRWLAWVLPLATLGGVALLAWDLFRHAPPMAYRRALRAYADGDDEAAWQALAEAQREQPDYATTYLLQARVSRRRGELAASERAARRYLALAPDAYHGHAELGLTHLAQGAPQEAIRSLERAAALAPYLPEAHLNLGLAQAENGQHGAAIESLAQALRLGLRDGISEVMARYQLWRALRAEGRLTEAERELRALRRRRRVLRAWGAELADVRLRHPTPDLQREEALWREIEAALRP